MSSNTFFTSKECEKYWVNSVTLACHTESEIEIKPCVFRLSKELKDTKAEAYYTPQKLRLGPFHHCQESWKIGHKISIVKQYLKTSNLQQILDFFKRHSKSFEPTIRLCYGAELDLNIETLLLIVIIDTICLLHFINTYLGTEKRKQEPHDHEWVRDIMMLENQIPLILIRGVLRNLKELKNLKNLDSEVELPTEDDLFDKYYRFCSKLYPVKLANVRESMKKEFSKTYHLLHFLLQFVVGKTLLDVSQGEFAPSRHHRDEVRYVLKESKDLLTKIKGQIILLQEQQKPEHGGTQSGGDMMGKLIEALNNFIKKEPEVPPVSDLQNSNIRCDALDGHGFGSFTSDNESRTFYVPIMPLDENTEVILRNLLAYEAAVKEADLQEVKGDVGFSEVKDHMGLMCALTKTEDDVALLKERKIIKTEMEKKDVVEIFKRLKECLEKQHLTSKFVDMCKRNANKFPDNDPLVKAFKKINKWVDAFFKFLKTVFPLLLVLLLFFQSFCEIYNCRRRPLSGTLSFLSLDSQAEIMAPRKVLRYLS